MDDLEAIAADRASDIVDATPSTVAQLRFQLEFGVLMLSCGRDAEARTAFRRAFDLLDLLET